MIEVNLTKLRGSCIDNPAVVLSDIVLNREAVRIFLLEDQEEEVMKVLKDFGYRVRSRKERGNVVVIEAFPGDS